MSNKKGVGFLLACPFCDCVEFVRKRTITAGIKIIGTGNYAKDYIADVDIIEQGSEDKYFCSKCDKDLTDIELKRTDKEMET